jgi:hypothetical protein
MRVSGDPASICVSFSLSVEAFVDANVMATAGGGCLCKPCGKIMGKKNMKRHVEQIHVNVGIIYQCPICKVDKNTKTALQNHVYKQHPEMKGIDYNQCQLKEQ